MAFGTGHHETTYMVIETMRTLNFHNKLVFDYGCGTGILAILASKLGAQHIDAVDIEQASFENTIENSKINGVDNLKTYLGSLEVVKNTGYDIILANINRNVILASLSTLYNKLKPSGILIVSGFLGEDLELLKSQAIHAGFRIGNERHKNKWICLGMMK